jgi:hypothetical protein
MLQSKNLIVETRVMEPKTMQKTGAISKSHTSREKINLNFSK